MISFDDKWLKHHNCSFEQLIILVLWLQAHREWTSFRCRNIAHILASFLIVVFSLFILIDLIKWRFSDFSHKTLTDGTRQIRSSLLHLCIPLIPAKLDPCHTLIVSLGTFSELTWLVPSSSPPLLKNADYFNVISIYRHQIFRVLSFYLSGYSSLSFCLDHYSASAAFSTKTRTWGLKADILKHFILAGLHHTSEPIWHMGTATQLESAQIPPSYTGACSVVFGLAVCCRSVGNMQTLDPLRSQLAPTSNVLLDRITHTHAHTHNLNSEKGKTYQPELQLGEIITVVKNMACPQRQTCFSQTLSYSTWSNNTKISSTTHACKGMHAHYQHQGMHSQAHAQCTQTFSICHHHILCEYISNLQPRWLFWLKKKSK